MKRTSPSAIFNLDSAIPVPCLAIGPISRVKPVIHSQGSDIGPSILPVALAAECGARRKRSWKTTVTSYWQGYYNLTREYCVGGVMDKIARGDGQDWKLEARLKGSSDAVTVIGAQAGNPERSVARPMPMRAKKNSFA
jgi:hypothetical protein